MLSLLLDKVKEKGIVDIIIHYKNGLEHYEKYSNVLQDLYLTYNIYNELNLTKRTEVCFGQNDSYYYKRTTYTKSKNKIRIDTCFIYSKSNYYIDLSSFRVL